MSGAISQHRPGNRPLIVDGQPVIKLDRHGRPVMKHRLIPGPVSANGRPTEYQIFEYPATMHVLDYAPEYHRPSKHARGRIRPRTRAEQRRAENLQARFVRASKRITELRKQGGIVDELAALAA